MSAISSNRSALGHVLLYPFDERLLDEPLRSELRLPCPVPFTKVSPFLSEVNPIKPRDIRDPNYGREEFLVRCINLARENQMIQLEGEYRADHLPLVLQNKYGSVGSVWLRNLKHLENDIIRIREKETGHRQRAIPLTGMMYEGIWVNYAPDLEEGFEEYLRGIFGIREDGEAPAKKARRTK